MEFDTRPLLELRAGSAGQTPEELFRALYPWARRNAFLLTLHRKSVDPVVDTFFVRLLEPYWNREPVTVPGQTRNLFSGVGGWLRNHLLGHVLSEDELLRRLQRAVEAHGKSQSQLLVFVGTAANLQTLTAEQGAWEAALAHLAPLKGAERCWLDRQRWRAADTPLHSDALAEPPQVPSTLPAAWGASDDAALRSYLHSVAASGDFDQAWRRIHAVLNSRPRKALDRLGAAIQPYLTMLENGVRWLLVAVFGVAMMVVALRLWHWYVEEHKIVAAVGGEDGESYRFMRALELVLEARHCNVNLELQTSAGSESNLELFASGEADFAATQADVLLKEWLGAGKGILKGGLHGGIIALLFQDRCQLLVCAPEEGADSQPLSAASALRGLRPEGQKIQVYLPYKEGVASGGQQHTFQEIAKEYGLWKGEHYAFRSEVETPGCGGSNGGKEQGNLVFRVRRLGNQDVKGAIEAGWRMVSLAQAASLYLRNKALYPDEIKSGTYRRNNKLIDNAVPAEPVATFAVDRILVARSDARGAAPDWLIKEITQIIATEGHALAKAELMEPRPERGVAMCYFEAASARLQRWFGNDGKPASAARKVRSPAMFLEVHGLNNLERLKQLGLPLHPGAEDHHDPDRTWFAKLNASADGLSILFTLLSAGGAGTLAFFGFLSRMRKERADSLIKYAIQLMRRHGEGGAQTAGDELLAVSISEQAASLRTKFGAVVTEAEDQAHVEALADALARQGILTEIFNHASAALDRDEISQESFRTFNEAYRAAVAAVERELEDERRELALRYVRKFIEARSANEVNGILKQAHPIITAPLFFSRESFRTFMGAYRAARESFR